MEERRDKEYIIEVTADKEQQQQAIHRIAIATGIETEQIENCIAKHTPKQPFSDGLGGGFGRGCVYPHTRKQAHTHMHAHIPKRTRIRRRRQHTTNGIQTDRQKQRRKRQMTNMDALLILGSVAFLAMYAAWMWDEVKKATPNPYDSEESQNKGAQAHEMTSDEEIPSNETKTQQEAQK